MELNAASEKREQRKREGERDIEREREGGERESLVSVPLLAKMCN